MTLLLIIGSTGSLAWIVGEYVLLALVAALWLGLWPWQRRSAQIAAGLCPTCGHALARLPGEPPRAMLSVFAKHAALVYRSRCNHCGFETS